MTGFTIGAVVRLKTGGPLMTIYHVDQHDGFFSCDWFSDVGKCTLCTDVFSPTDIEKVKPEQDLDEILSRFP